MGVGWQDPAVIVETGLCVWRSDSRPLLDVRIHPSWLGLEATMALLWTGRRKNHAAIGRQSRDLDLIQNAGRIAREAVLRHNRPLLYDAVDLSYHAQRAEGMISLPNYGEQAKKYCGAGFGGMAIYCFHGEDSRNRFLATVEGTQAVEPYWQEIGLQDAEYPNLLHRRA